MSSVKVHIWDRDFDLYVSYQNYPGEEITHNQTLTLERISDIDFDGSLNDVKQYIMKNNGSEVNGNNIDNVFRYVMPKSILIIRDDNARVFAIMCNYKFDMEHGIAVVYQDEKIKTIGPQDLIL